MDWFNGKSTGNFPIKYGGFPVNFPLNQSIESFAQVWICQIDECWLSFFGTPWLHETDHAAS